MAAPSFQETGRATIPAASFLEELELADLLLLLETEELTDDALEDKEELTEEALDDREETDEAATLLAETKLLIVLAEEEAIVVLI